MEFKPLARSSDLVVQKVNDETLVYNLKTHKAQCLNETSAIIWDLCDGTRTIEDMTSALSMEFQTQVDQALVRLAIGQLQKEELLENDSENSLLLKGASRRALLRKVGLATAIALPLVSSIVAPIAASAATGVIPPDCETDPGDGCACVSPTAPNNGVMNCVDAMIAYNQMNNPLCDTSMIGPSNATCENGKCPPGLDPNQFKCCLVNAPLPPNCTFS